MFVQRLKAVISSRTGLRKLIILPFVGIVVFLLVITYLLVYSYTAKISECMDSKLAIAIQESAVAQDLENLLFHFTITLVLIFLAAIVLGIGAANRIIDPIKVLNEKVLDIRNGNWGIRIECQQGGILGELTHSFNDMSQQLQTFYGSMVQKNKELENLNAHLEDMVNARTEKLRKISITDELTGAYNHRHIIACLTMEIAAATRYHTSLALVIFDIDFFKQVNDTYGHVDGDKVIASVAACLQENARKTDILGRYGGEEFFLILPNTSLEQAYALTERLRILISSLLIGDRQIKVTVSGGIAVYRGENMEEFIRRADQSLYQAKAAGRNRMAQY